LLQLLQLSSGGAAAWSGGAGSIDVLVRVRGTETAGVWLSGIADTLAFRLELLLRALVASPDLQTSVMLRACGSVALRSVDRDVLLLVLLVSECSTNLLPDSGRKVKSVADLAAARSALSAEVCRR